MNILPITNSEINCRGKFVIPENLSEKERQALNVFTEYKGQRRNNIQKFVERKSYDVVLKRCETDPKLLEFWTSFDTFWSKKPQDVYISSFHPANNVNTNANYFHTGIDWLEAYKKENYGYNNKFEKLKENIKFYFCG